MLKRLFTILIATLFVFATNYSNADERIKMTYENGVYTIPCEVNGVPLRFIIDTGACMVSISMTEARFMYKNGYIDENDFIGTAKTRIANGDLEENMKLNLKEVKVGNKTLNNVEALVSKSSNAPLLLGQSVLRQLGTWSVDGDYLVIHNGKTNNIAEANDDYEKKYIAEEAERYYTLAISFQQNKKYKSAFNYFRAAAELGHLYAQIRLGFCYFDGIGVDKNEELAVYWYEKAAKQGDSYAQYMVGLSYDFGIGVTENNERAVYWFTKSAEQGEEGGQFYLAKHYYSGAGVQQNKQLALYWYQKAAEQGHIEAQYILGLLYIIGEGVPQSKKEAKYWFRKAAAQGHKDAQIKLEKLQ